MPLSRDEIQALADERYENDNYDTPDQRAFALLVDVAGHVYESYRERFKIDLEDPDSFKPKTLGGVNYGWGLLEGLKENLEMNYPDGNFREML